MNLKNKKVLVMGLGLIGGGVETVKWLVQEGAKVLVTDLKTKGELRPSLRKLKNLPVHPARTGGGVKYHLGGHREKDFKNVDLIIKNPSVPNDSPFLKIARKNRIPIETDISLFFKLWPASTRSPRCRESEAGLSRRGGPEQIIGITGTKGKSTTTALIGEIFKEAGLKSFVAGNIGQSPLKYLSKTRINTDSIRTNADNILCKSALAPLDNFISNGVNLRKSALSQCQSAIMILELSSWQLESLAQSEISPQIALITNIYPDHLNRYKNVKEYIATKEIIFKYQNPKDFIILNYDNQILKKIDDKIRSQIIWFSRKTIPLIRANKRNIHSIIFIRDKKIFLKSKQGEQKICSLKNIKLNGRHNLENILAAVAVACLYQIKPKEIRLVLKNFSGLPNRLELIGIFNGLKYYNDTTATTPEATIAALTSFGQPKIKNFALSFSRKDGARKSKIKNIVLIAGGADKKLKFKKLASVIKKTCRSVILFQGTATPKIKKQLSAIDYRPMIEVNSMKMAIKEARRFARPGDIILLSPACASFGLFTPLEIRQKNILSKIKNKSLRNYILNCKKQWGLKSLTGFKNEFDRGKQFVKLVKWLIS